MEGRRNPFPFFRGGCEFFGRKEGGGRKIVRKIRWGWFYLKRGLFNSSSFFGKEDVMRKSLILVLAGLFLTLMAVPAFAQGTLKIGAPQPMTGPDAPFGSKFQKAYGMALEEINAKGGIKGKKL